MKSREGNYVVYHYDLTLRLFGSCKKTESLTSSSFKDARLWSAIIFPEEEKAQSLSKGTGTTESLAKLNTAVEC